MRPTAASELQRLLAQNPLVRVSLLSHHAGSAPYIGSITYRGYALWSELRLETSQENAFAASPTTTAIEAALSSGLEAVGVFSASAWASLNRFAHAPPIFDAIIRLHGIHADEASASLALMLAARALFRSGSDARDPLVCPANDAIFKLGGHQRFDGLPHEATRAILARAEHAMLARQIEGTSLAQSARGRL